MTYTEFRKKIQNVDKKRVHKITKSIGVYDSYKWIRKNKWLDIGRPLKEGEFYRIIRKVNEYLVKELAKGKEIRLPHRLGVLEVRKCPIKLAIKDGKLVTNMPIDWSRTFQLWYSDEEAFNAKTLVRIETQEVFRIYYNKSTANYNNKSFYDFRPNRELKKQLSKQAREGNLEAHLLYKYD